VFPAADLPGLPVEAPPGEPAEPPDPPAMGASEREARRGGFAAAHDSADPDEGFALDDAEGFLLPAACLPRDGRWKGESGAKAQPILPTGTC